MKKRIAKGNYVILSNSEGSAFYGGATADKQQILRRAQDDKNYRFLKFPFCDTL